jgi:hypothetical protein
MKKTYRGTIRVDVVTEKIYVTAAFRKACANIESDEYTLLQIIKSENPTFKVEERSIKKNPNKESYRGLNYEFMERYILLHDGENSDVMDEYKELRLIAECHSISFPKIRDWFFETYPDVKNFTVEHLREEIDEQSVREFTRNETPIAA